MRNIIKGLYLGSDRDVETAIKRGYSRLSCCKDGIDSHRSMLGYTTLGAPKNDTYYFAQEGDWMALNLIDSPDPDMIPDQVIDAGLRFIKREMDKGHTVFVHCNAGHSRSTTMVLMYLRAIGELPQGFNRAQHIFRALYPEYDPGIGMRSHARVRWNSLPDFFKPKDKDNDR